MTITIGSNIYSLRAQRQLDRGTRTLSSVFERLATGSRINRASDDAAGLSISSALRVDAKLYTGAVRNINDAISALTIAESTIFALRDITIRQKELAIQAAQGTYSNRQRRALDAEANALVAEFNRITESATYNGKSLFASDSTWTIQTGINGNAESQLAISFIDGLFRDVGTGTYATAVTYVATGTFGVEALDLNGDGNVDIIGAPNTAGSRVQVLLGNGDGSFLAATTYFVGNGPSGQFNDISGADINNDGFIDLVATYDGVQVSVLLGNGDGSFDTPIALPASVTRTAQLFDFNNDGNLDIISSQSGTFVTFLGNGDGTFRSPVTTASTPTPSMVAVGDIDGDGVLDVIGINSTYQVHRGRGDGTFEYMGQIGGGFSPLYGRLADFDHDGDLDLVGANYNANAGTSVSVYLNNGNGTFAAGVTYTTTNGPYTLEVADLDNDGYIDIATANPSGVRNILLGNGNGTFQAALTSASLVATSFTLALADFNGDNVLDIASSSNVSGISVLLAETEQSMSSPILNLYTQSSAKASLGELDRTMARLSAGLSSIGAALSRLDVNARLAEASKLTAETAMSRILDADIAQESSLLLKSQILQQIQQSIMAQANAAPQIALQLLST